MLSLRLSTHSVDLIIDKGTMDAFSRLHQSDCYQALDEISRVCKPNGVVLQVIFHIDNHWQVSSWARINYSFILMNHAHHLLFFDKLANINAGSTNRIELHCSMLIVQFWIELYSRICNCAALHTEQE